MQPTGRRMGKQHKIGAELYVQSASRSYHFHQPRHSFWALMQILMGRGTRVAFIMESIV